MKRAGQIDRGKTPQTIQPPTDITTEVRCCFRGWFRFGVAYSSQRATLHDKPNSRVRSYQYMRANLTRERAGWHGGCCKWGVLREEKPLATVQLLPLVSVIKAPPARQVQLSRAHTHYNTHTHTNTRKGCQLHLEGFSKFYTIRKSEVHGLLLWG